MLNSKQLKSVHADNRPLARPLRHVTFSTVRFLFCDQNPTQIWPTISCHVIKNDTNYCTAQSFQLGPSFCEIHSLQISTSQIVNAANFVAFHLKMIAKSVQMKFQILCKNCCKFWMKFALTVGWAIWKICHRLSAWLLVHKLKTRMNHWSALFFFCFCFSTKFLLIKSCHISHSKQLLFAKLPERCSHSPWSFKMHNDMAHSRCVTVWITFQC